jgi:hypothetical protein
MTAKERKEWAAAAEKLRTVEQVARTAIASMEQDASFFSILAGASWMEQIDPTGQGPKFICTSTAAHNTRLAAELTGRLNA